MQRVTEPLAATGAQFLTREGGRLPLAVRGATNPLPLDYRVPVASAQVKSACLLAGLCARGTTRVIEAEATRDHTENMLRHFGASVHVAVQGHGRIIELAGQPELRAAPVSVPGDPSSAAFLAAAALLVPGSEVVIDHVGMNPLRAGLFTTLAEMGADITQLNPRVEGGEPVADLRVRAGNSRGMDVPPERAPSMIDEYPILAVIAATAAGTTRMRGLKELTVKESDRLAGTAAMLAAAGARVEVDGEDLIVHGGALPGGGVVTTHMDHRLAMSGLVLGLAARGGMGVDDGGFIDTSFPGFAALMNQAAGAEVIR
jgi:3-phosphoshikimate 1-carboxyvinyltransferase